MGKYNAKWFSSLKLDSIFPFLFYSNSVYFSCLIYPFLCKKRPIHVPKCFFHFLFYFILFSFLWFFILDFSMQGRNTRKCQCKWDIYRLRRHVFNIVIRNIMCTGTCMYMCALSKNLHLKQSLDQDSLLCPKSIDGHIDTLVGLMSIIQTFHRVKLFKEINPISNLSIRVVSHFFMCVCICFRRVQNEFQGIYIL